MGNKISTNVLSGMLAQATGKSKKSCEDFIREFFRLVADSLLEGESLKIKGFGTFKLSEMEGRRAVNVNTGEPHELAPYKKVIFTPAKELASAINAPFEDFESVEIEDEMPEEVFYEEREDADESIVEGAVLFKEDAINGEEIREENVSDENRVGAGILNAGSLEEGEDDDITYEAYETLEEEKDKTGSEEKEEIESEEEDPAYIAQPREERIVLPVYEEEEPRKSRFGIGFLVGALSTFVVCAVIFMLGCFFDWWPVNFGGSNEAKAVEQEIMQTEEIQPEEEEANTEMPVVYDTVTTTRYLTTIARDHYGNFNFWPYIYEENESILGHPDRITPGTQVVVPDLSKYGVDPSNPEDVAKAKKLGLEIYAKFR